MRSYIMNNNISDSLGIDTDIDIDRVIIFLGPSLKRDLALSILDGDEIEYRPPARKGDLLKINNNRNNSNDSNTLVCLIDGVFLQDYPPTPIEVYTLMQRGVKVFGAASIGALRAVELERLGMVGIGRIFRLYKNGILEDDDEVAVTFSGDDYTLASEAMIDIRYTLYHAYKSSMISRESKRILTRIAKSIYFPYRSYDLILEKAKGKGIIDDEQLSTLKEYIKYNRRSLKEEDSIELLNHVRSML
jgi:TfuA protein